VTQSENKCSSYEYRHDIAFSSWTEMRWAAFKFFLLPNLIGSLYFRELLIIAIEIVLTTISMVITKYVAVKTKSNFGIENH